MKKKIKQQQKFKYRHLLLGRKGKKRLVKKNNSRFSLVSRTSSTLNFTAKHIEIIRRIFYKPVTDFLGGFILSRIYPYNLYQKNLYKHAWVKVKVKFKSM